VPKRREAALGLMMNPPSVIKAGFFDAKNHAIEAKGLELFEN